MIVVEERLERSAARWGGAGRRYIRSWWSVSCGETMLRVNVFQFYRFGYAIQLLATIDKDMLVIDQYSGLSDADKALTDLLSQEQIPLNDIAPAIENLRSEISRIMTRIVQDDFDSAEKIKPSHAAGLRNALRRFETVFEAEVTDRVNVYSVSVKGIYNTSLLIQQADRAIPAELRVVLSDSAQYDLKQSGRCLAFEVPTASGFHALRATESVIKDYYKRLTGNEWDAVHRPSQRNWGRYIDDLKEAGAKTSITASLEHIKDHYRNPIAHPEAVLATNEALSLFSLALSVISLMLEEIRS